MGIDDTIRKISAELGNRVLGIDRHSDKRAYLEIAPQTVIAAAQLMYQKLGARFQIATGVDIREGFEIMYHWVLDEEGFIITMRTMLDHEKPEVDSIAPILPAAEWIEREMWELLGINFRRHPDLRHLLLADDWPQGNYPLRRNYPLRCNHPLRGEGEATP